MVSVQCPVCEENGIRTPESDQFNRDDTCNECRKEISILIRIEEITELLDIRD